MAFVKPDLPMDIRRANFVVVLEWLRNLSGKDDTPLQEACIMTLCGLALYASDPSLTFVLYLTHAYLESRKMKRRTSFFYGFWSTSVIQIPTFAQLHIMR